MRKDERMIHGEGKREMETEEEAGKQDEMRQG